MPAVMKVKAMLPLIFAKMSASHGQLEPRICNGSKITNGHAKRFGFD
jgi:hypothetical protein